MNKLLAFTCAALLALGCSHTTPSIAQSPMNSYGKEITADGAINVEDFAKLMSTTDSADVKLEAEVISTCRVKGCWMDVQMPDGKPMKVRFVDYKFFVPKEGMEGKRTILQGTATRETIDVATLRHYAEDAGKSKEEIAKITEPRHQLTFLAEGVLIGD